MLSKFLNILFPETCPVCQRPTKDHAIAPFCAHCWQTVSAYEGPACARCGRPPVCDVSTTCGECLQDEFAFTSAWSFGLYNGALKKAINLLNDHNVKRLSKLLSDIITAFKTPVVDAVVPVPLYEKRLRQREYNQSALLAKNLAKSLGVAVILNCLAKVRDSAPQVGLRLQERRKKI